MTDDIAPSRMTSSRPYLIRAFYEWILDNALTPHVVVNAEMPDVHVPTQYVEEGRIVLNISPTAVSGLVIQNDYLDFKARFKGVLTHVCVPIYAVLAIYAKENGRGMLFNEDDEDEQTSPPPKRGKPHLTIVK